MRRLVTVGSGVAALAAVLVAGIPVSPAHSTPTAPAAPLSWAPCDDPALPGLECAMLEVPLDHRRPGRRTIAIALSRVKASGPARSHQGALLINPGGPGASGRAMAGYLATRLPRDVAAGYDIIGFDPRGVGASRPALACDPGYMEPVRPDYVPGDRRQMQVLRRRVAGYAAACARAHPTELPYMTTRDAARDLDAIRRALGADTINYYGYSYGSHLGAVYATLFPGRVRRFVLDSVVHPHYSWYRTQLAQDHGFDLRHKALMGWIARYDEAYHLGTDPARIEARWYRMRDRLGTAPAGGVVGPSELDDTFAAGGYFTGHWPRLAQGFSAYALRGDPAPLVQAYRDMGLTKENTFAVYLATQCGDGGWPTSWRTWVGDARRIHRTAPFLVWNNVWFNAACRNWPVTGGTRVRVRDRGLPPVLVLQGTDDAATPYAGGLAMHRLLRRSRLVVEVGGGNHGVGMMGNGCVDDHVVAYLRDATLPADRPGADALCPARPDPVPVTVETRVSGPTRAPAEPAHPPVAAEPVRPVATEPARPPVAG